MDDVLALQWCRLVYFDPTNTRGQIAAAWRCAELIVGRNIKNNPWR